MHKTSKFDAAQDLEEEGGVFLEADPLSGDGDIDEVQFEALKPEDASDAPSPEVFAGPYPPLPSRAGVASSSGSDIASTLGSMSLSSETDTVTVVGSPRTATRPGSSLYSAAAREGSSTASSHTSSTKRQLKVWDSRPGRPASKKLFPNAKPTPVPAEFSIAAHDQAMEEKNGINIMRTRFWDPLSTDWNPEKFYNAIINKYACPFVCE